MQLPKKVTKKSALAAIIVGFTIAFSIKLLSFIPSSVLSATGFGISIGIGIFAVGVVIASWVILIPPFIWYVLKWIHWAFRFFFWADKKEPTFPPTFNVVKVWESIGKLGFNTAPLICLFSVLTLILGIVSILDGLVWGFPVAIVAVIVLAITLFICLDQYDSRYGCL